MTINVKQGSVKHFKRRIENRRAKRHNRRLWIEQNGGGWYFYQSSFHYTYYGGTWDGYVKHINDIVLDPKNANADWIENLERKFEKNKKDLLPHPSEEQCRTKYTRYRDDYPPCDRSGRQDLRPKMLKDLHWREMYDYLTGYVNPNDDFIEEDTAWEKKDALWLTEQFLDMEEEEYNCQQCGRPGYVCTCFDKCPGCGAQNYRCSCSDLCDDEEEDSFTATFGLPLPCCGLPWAFCNCEKLEELDHKLTVLEGYCHACHSHKCSCGEPNSDT